MSSQIERVALLVVTAAGLLACAELRSDDDTLEIDSGKFSIVVDGDSEVRSLATDVDVRVELRGPGEDAWEATLQARFEPKGSKEWPLHLDAQLTTGPRGTQCQLRATARDTFGAIVARAETRRACERAAADGLRARLAYDPDVPPAADAVVPDEPEVPQQIAPECVARTSSIPFCDGEVIRVCVPGLSVSEIRPCAEHERCYEPPSGGARCDCAVGFVWSAKGGCEAAAGCGPDDGGCAP